MTNLTRGSELLALLDIRLDEIAPVGETFATTGASGVAMTGRIDVRRLAFRAAIAAVVSAVLVAGTLLGLLLETFRRYGLL